MKARTLFNKTALSVLFFFPVVLLHAQTIEKLFINMPDDLYPTMNRQQRLEFVEYKKAGLSDSAHNRLGGVEHIELFDSVGQHILIHPTVQSAFDMRVFTDGNQSPFIGIIETFCAPACHSYVQFYDTAWKKLPLTYDMPDSRCWLDSTQLNLKQNINVQWVKNAIKTSFVSLRFDKKEPEMIATNNTFDFLSDDEKKKAEPFLIKKELYLRLTNNCWKKVER